MLRKRNVILDAFRENKANFLDVLTLLIALEKRGFKMSKKGLSNFIRNNLEYKYLVSSRDPNGTIIGWTLIKSI